MSMLKSKMQLSAIGLEIDAHEFRAVQLTKSAKGTSTLAWAIFPRQISNTNQTLGSLPEAEELRWAAAILGRRGFVGNHVSIAPSTSACSSHAIELPPKESGAPIDQLARMEVARARKCGPEDFELGHWYLPAKGRTQESLAVACSRAVIDDTIERYEKAGLIPVGIDLMELAIHRGTQVRSVEVDNEINASLRIGWKSSLAVLTLGETVVYVRRIERGASSVWELASKRYRLSPEAADVIVDDLSGDAHAETYAKIRRAVWSGLANELTSELDVALTYVSHAYRMAPFGKIRMSGYGALNSAIEERIAQVLGIPLACDSFVNLQGQTGSDEQSAASIGCRLSTAYGLAARFDQ
ncbi:hypothetical protein COB72_02150 [bacterium]|nr:MAG: hypothetical protein COB72_02150 [bacterium]